MTTTLETHAASIVRAIHNGEWTNEAPEWAPVHYDQIDIAGDLNLNYVRAVQTAEAFALLFRTMPNFSERRFLDACRLRLRKAAPKAA